MESGKCCSMSKCSAVKDDVKKGEEPDPADYEKPDPADDEKPDPADYEKLYFKAEFTAMDKGKRGKLTTAEFVKLMIFLGYGVEREVHSLLKSINTDEDGYITIDEFYDAMNRPEVKAGTSRLRNIFFKFDDNKDGRATNEQILQGFADMEFEVDDEITAKVNELDTDHDGRVAYQDFVQSQLVAKDILNKCSAAKDDVKKREEPDPADDEKPDPADDEKPDPADYKKPDPADYERLYFKAEFTAMDKGKRGKLTTAEFVKLMIFLGYGVEREVHSLLKTINTDKDGYITIDEFYDAMNRPEVKAGTSRLRNIFFKFDDNKDGRATNEQILQGFADMEFEVDDEITAKVNELDTDHDGRVAYQDFVQSQLVAKGILK